MSSIEISIIIRCLLVKKTPKIPNNSKVEDIIK